MALQGTFTVHQRLMLARMLGQLNDLEVRLADLTADIEQRVAGYQELLTRIATIPGLDRISAWTVLAEIGTDMKVFEDAAHLASWAALCPGNRESGGKRISGKTRKGNRYLRRVLCQAAWAASHKKDSHLSALYRRVRTRRGEKAIMAVAHQLITIIFHIVRDGDRERRIAGQLQLSAKYDHAASSTRPVGSAATSSARPRPRDCSYLLEAMFAESAVRVGRTRGHSTA